MEYYKTIINHLSIPIKVGAIIRPRNDSRADDYTTTWSDSIAPGNREVLRLDKPTEGMPFLNGLRFQSSAGDAQWHVSAKDATFEHTINTNHTLIIQGNSLEDMKVRGENPY